MKTFEELIEKSKIIISVGCGGVGKTTTSAAIALEAAIRGKKTIVLTIDPAKRLANSLGIQNLNYKAQKVDLSSLGNPKGELYAMMLDMKSAMDDMVNREGTSQKTKENLFKNKIYQIFSTSLSGTQDFAAMEKLWEIFNSNIYDLIVLDTPPTTNTLDFLTFPERINDTFDNKITQLLISVYKKSGSFAFRFFGFGTQMTLKGISKFVGIETLDVLSSFLFHISELIEGMKKRSNDIFKLLRSEDVNFVIVTTPTPLAIKESIFFKEQLKKLKVNFYGFIVNRYHKKFETKTPIQTEDIVEILKKEEAFSSTSEYKLNLFSKKLKENLMQFNKLSKIEDKHLKNLEGNLFIKIPFFDKDIYNLDGLSKISKEIFKKE